MTKYSLHGIDTSTAKHLSGRDYARELVRTRDNYTCQNCDKKWQVGKRRFDVHHLNGLCGKLSTKSDKVNDLAGLITLCHKCHFNHPQHSKQLDGSYSKDRSELLELLSQGLSYQDIGDRLGISKQRVHQILK